MSEVPPDSFDFYLNLAKPLVLNLADSNGMSIKFYPKVFHN